MQQDVYDAFRRKNLRDSKCFSQYMRKCKSCGAIFTTVFKRPKKCEVCKQKAFEEGLRKRGIVWDEEKEQK